MQQASAQPTSQPAPTPGSPVPAPPAAPTPPAAPAAPEAGLLARPGGVGGVVAGAPGSSRDIYRGFRAQREELGSQLERLEDRRRELSNTLRESGATGADRAGMEARIAEIDKRISSVEAQIAAADAQVAQAAALPGATVEPPAPPRDPTEEYVEMGIVASTILMIPIVIAYARRIWRRSASVGMAIPRELMERFTHLEQSVDAVALEVERIGEGQRFLTHHLADQAARSLGAGAAQTVDVPLREAVPQRR